jgi:energy-coupling factor transporter ATP-binding protein EcfA2
MDCLYSLKNVSLCYSSFDDKNNAVSIPALNDLTLNIYKNEFLVVLGTNGSGKSSLGRLLTGIAGEFRGEIIYKGDKIEDYNRDTFGSTALVIQEPQNQILMPSVYEELAFPLKNRGVEIELLEPKVKETAALFNLVNLLDKNPEELSGGQITLLAMAAAVITDPEIVIFDEPDSHLDRRSMAILNEFIDRYRREKTIMLISQFPDTARDADRVLIIDRGSLKFQGSPDDVFPDPHRINAGGLEFGLGVAEHNAGIGHKSNGKPADSAKADPAISLKNVSFSYENDIPVLADINLTFYTGEKIGLIGPAGSGKTTLGLITAGLLKRNKGIIEISGKPIDSYSPKKLRRKVTMAMQFPERALFEDTVYKDIAFGPANLGYDGIESIVNEKLTQFKLQYLSTRHPFSLSGGEKRKAALAGVLAMETPIVILDEPTAALDPDSAEELRHYLELLQDRTVIIIGHDLNLILRTCYRIIEIEGGLIVKDQAADEFFENRDILPPTGISLANNQSGTL